jgi:eukaryotic-like serine/threonine-protein kinase
VAATPASPQGKVVLDDLASLEEEDSGLPRSTLMSRETTPPPPRRGTGSTGGSVSKSRPVRPMRYDSASQPDLCPLIQDRLRLIAAIAVIGSVVATGLLSWLGRGGLPGGWMGLLLLHGSGILLNIGLFLVYSRPGLSHRVLGLLQSLTFVGNMIVFVALPTLEIGLRADIYNAASIIVLCRSIFIPCVWQFSLVFGLILWSIYPLTVLVGAQFVPQLAADLADPMLRNHFVMGNFDIGMSLLIGLVAVYTLHALRVQAFQAEQAGSYRLLEKLGEGGMGEVYSARHALLHRPTAIKMLRSDLGDSPTALKRFEREVRAASELTHPNTISIYDFGKTDAGRFYYAMEFLDGMDLQDLVERYGALPPARATYIVDQILGSLGEAHWRGILHRDVKPSNVYLTVRGRQFDFAKVLDFGLVKEVGLDPRFTAGLTSDTAVTGTPLYMAPERFYGNQDADHRSDLYAVGAVAYFLVAGRPVFDAKNPMQALIDHVRTPPTPPRQLGVSLSDELEGVILKALEKEPAQRYASADDFAEALHGTPEWGAWSQGDAKEWWSRHLPEATASTRQPITPGA